MNNTIHPFNYKRDHLASDEWRIVKEQTWKHYRHSCAICWKPYNLNRHHLSYAHLGQRDEWKDVRIVCHYHHLWACHRFLFIIPIPKTRFWLTLRYIELRIDGAIKHYSVELIKWVIMQYTLNDTPRFRRKVTHWGRGYR